MQPIHAEVHSDDYRHQVDFDALPWFEQATDEEIVALAACGWGGDYEADEVALFFEDKNPAIAVLLDHCRAADECGFECHVDEADALAWVRKHRPALEERLA